MNVTGLRGRGRKGAPEGVPVTIVKVGTKRVWGNPENLLYPVMGEKGVWCRLGLVLDCKSAPRKPSYNGVKVSVRMADRHLGGRGWPVVDAGQALDGGRRSARWIHTQPTWHLSITVDSQMLGFL
jgi:hypothetical protein